MSAPVKTPLGMEEMRHRTRGLGQRYRTVLLLVDGRRPLGEVLAMAHKAGAQTSHFEELVRLGLIEVSSEAAAPEPLETMPGALDVPLLTSIELEVDTDEAPTIPLKRPVPPPATEADGQGVDIDLDLLQPPAPKAAAAMATSFPPALVPQQLDEWTGELSEAQSGDAARPASASVLDKLAEVMTGPQAPVAEAAAVPAAQPLKTRIASMFSSSKPSPARYVPPVIDLNATPHDPGWMQQVREAPFSVADHARPAPKVSDEELLQMVRELLLDTLRRDTLLFGTFAAGRVRAAQTQRELINLVWEIERDRAHPRRSRDQLLNLQRARELLGMGNTLIAWDSQPQPPEEDG